jgi:putative transposase
MRRPKQQKLPLKLDRRHENPGRPKGKHPRMPHDKRTDFPSTNPCHVTLRVIPGLPSLRDGDVAREVESAFRRGCVRAEMRLVHYSIQDDHAHLIVEAKGAKALGC